MKKAGHRPVATLRPDDRRHRVRPIRHSELVAVVVALHADTTDHAIGIFELDELGGTANDREHRYIVVVASHASGDGLAGGESVVCSHVVSVYGQQLPRNT